MTTQNDTAQNAAPSRGRIEKPFGFGILGLVLGFLALLIAAWPVAKPESFSTAIMWTIGLWPIPFLLGLVFLILGGLGDKRSLLSALTAYLLPPVALFVAALVCVAIYPSPSFTDELSGFLPVAGLFSIFGWAWMRLRASAGPGGQWLRAAMPPLFGGFMILAFVVVPVFTSNAFLYRNAFVLNVIKVERSDGGLLATCVLEVHKPGHYRFSAPSHFFMEPILMEGEHQMPVAKIIWGAAGEPGEGADGSFPLQISWDKLPSYSDDLYGGMQPMDTALYLEARHADQPDNLLITISSRSEPPGS